MIRMSDWFARLFVVCGMAVTLAGCSTVSDVMEKVGLKQPTLAEVKAAVPLIKEVTLRVHAGEALNVDSNQRPLSVVVRIYRLRTTEAFLAAPLTAFKDADAEKAAFGADLVSAREVVLTPRQKYEVVEPLGTDVKFIAVVGLFRAPSQGRWRFVFDKDAAAKTGVTLGAHACAFSVSSGEALGTSQELTRLTGMRCG